MGEFWSLEDDEQLTLQKKKLEEIITRRTNIVDSTTIENNIRNYERLDDDNDDNSILSFLEKNKPSIPSELRSPPMTRFFLHKNNSDHHLTLRSQD